MTSPTVVLPECTSPLNRTNPRDGQPVHEAALGERRGLGPISAPPQHPLLQYT